MKDPYAYDGTNVLINKLDIRNGDKLDKAESDFLGLAVTKLKNSNFKVKSIYDALLIHKELFGEIYEWAGKIRTIDIYKGEDILDGRSIDYVFASYLTTALDELDAEFKKIKWNELKELEKINNICYFISEFWHIHPFMEGNTRTTAMLLYFLIKNSGLHINIDFLSKNGKYFRNALVLSSMYSNSKKEFLFGIVEDSVSIKNKVSKKYETINGYDIKKYSYTSHTMDKLKTIKKPKDWSK